MKKREYVITDGKKFVQKDFRGIYKQTSSCGLADIYETEESATKVLKNSIPRSWRTTYYVAELINGELCQCSLPKPKVEKGEGAGVYKLNYFKDSSVDIEWCHGFRELDGIFKKAANRANALAKELVEVEKDVKNAYHDIEFSNLNAREGYKAYRNFREILRKRRRLKNESRIVNAINANHAASTLIENIIKEINFCDKQEYKPFMTDSFLKNSNAFIKFSEEKKE